MRYTIVTSLDIFVDWKLFFVWRKSSTRARTASFLTFLDHAQWHTTVSWSARPTDVYVTKTTMPLAGFFCFFLYVICTSLCWLCFCPYCTTHITQTPMSRIRTRNPSKALVSWSWRDNDIKMDMLNLWKIWMFRRKYRYVASARNQTALPQ
jgi:hypothetical protein